MNAIVPTGFGPVPAAFRNANLPRESLGDGITGGFGVVGYKGKVWSIRKGGDTTNLMRADGDGPVNSIEVVVLKAAGVISKVFYKNGWVEGSTEPPDCYSTNGVTPAVGSKEKQCGSCGVCPHNQWGSRITPAGKQGKACSDSKRLAVVPMNDITNEVYGGPMLLRVPAGSLTDLKMFGDKMAALGYQYYTFGTRIAFDTTVSHPKFVFNPIRVLTDAEADLVMSLRDGPEVARVLAEDEHVGTPALPAPAASPFEQPPQPVQTPSNVIPMTRSQAPQNPCPTPAQTPVTPTPQTTTSPGTGAVSTASAPTVALTGAPATTSSAPATAPSPSLPAIPTEQTPSLQTSQPAGGAQAAGVSPETAPTGVQSFDDMLEDMLK